MRSAADFLDAGQPGQKACEHARRLLACQRALEESHPIVAAGCSISHLKNGALVIVADNGALAAKLKQSAGSVLRKLRATSELAEIRSIEILVQPRTGPARMRKSATLTGASLRQLERCAERIADPPLKAALDRMVARQRQGSVEDPKPRHKISTRRSSA